MLHDFFHASQRAQLPVFVEVERTPTGGLPRAVLRARLRPMIGTHESQAFSVNDDHRAMRRHAPIIPLAVKRRLRHTSTAPQSDSTIRAVSFALCASRIALRPS